MKNKKVILIVLGVVVVAALIVTNLLMDTSKAISVNTAEILQDDITEEVSASGRIQPRSKVDITSEINGEIITLAVKEGQPVNAGDLLVVLDTVQIASDVSQAKYRLDEIKARLEGARTSLEQAEEEFRRQEKLYEQQLTSETMFKNVRYAYLSSQSSHTAMEASTNQMQAAYEKQLDYFEKAKIVSPMTGVVTFLDVEVGEIAAAQTAFTQGRTLMTISDMSVFEVEVEVDETEINKIMLGQVSDIKVDAFPDTSFVGEVVEIGNTAIMANYGGQDQSTNFKVKVMFEDVDLMLRPGMSATVDMTTAVRENVLSLPFSAIVMRSYDMDSLIAARETETSGLSAVSEVQAAESDSTDDELEKKDDEEREDLKGIFILKDGVARFVEVETGIADQKNIEITVGVEFGDTVVCGPYRVLRTIKDGDEVEAIVKDDEEGEE
ncbi:MAG: hypothetical protein DRP45_07960 [Candidatus Zixiibacteriota bacterium]|nr:MAG: hypothetical protein DRP45_07960 [candidate division Zixibacteria bacterium]